MVYLKKCVVSAFLKLLELRVSPRDNGAGSSRPHYDQTDNRKCPMAESAAAMLWHNQLISTDRVELLITDNVQCQDAAVSKVQSTG